MKSFKTSLIESLLDDEDELLKQSDSDVFKKSVESWIRERFEVVGLEISNKPNSNNKFVVNALQANTRDEVCDTLTSLTNSMFVWGKIKYDFRCVGCKLLTSLEGAPEEVGFDMNSGGGEFNISWCRNLTSLVGGPKKVGMYKCTGCDKLTSLKGMASKAYYIHCYDCKKLASLKGAPKEVGWEGGGCFECNDNPSLTSLVGGPKKVFGTYNIDSCKKLTSLKGAPKEVIGEFSCIGCTNLKSLTGAPEYVDGNFYCDRCNSGFVEDKIKAVSKVRGKIFC